MLMIASVAGLIIHGLIHLMGTAVYMRFAQIQGLPYKTNLLNGRWEVGETGIYLFGALWVLPAVGFLATATALAAGWAWWRSLLLASALVSLVLTGLDWRVAFVGATVNIAILVLFWIGPRVAAWVG